MQTLRRFCRTERVVDLSAWNVSVDLLTGKIAVVHPSGITNFRDNRGPIDPVPNYFAPAYRHGYAVA